MTQEQIFTEETPPISNRNFNILPSGKKVGIYKVTNTSLYRIAFTSGGTLPDGLQGMWTDPYQAQRTIENYVKSKEREAKAEAERLQAVAEHDAKPLSDVSRGISKKTSGTKKVK